MIKQHGLSLIEVMVGLVLVGIAVTGLVSQTTLLSQQSSQLTQADEKARFAGRIMQEVKQAFTIEPTGTMAITGGTWVTESGLLSGVNLVVGDLLGSATTSTIYTVTSVDPTLAFGAAVTSGTFNVTTARGWLPNMITVDLVAGTAPTWLSSSDFTSWQDQLNASPGGVTTGVLTVDAVSPTDTALRKVTVAIDDIVLTQILTVPGL